MMNICSPSNIWICLCQPSDIRNIGGVIRLVANFGLAGLKVYRSSEGTLCKEQLMMFSSGALDKIIFKEYQQLALAVDEADLVIGTSRRPRVNQQLTFTSSHDMSRFLVDKKQPHILFGNERVGLLHEELDLCHLLVEIPSSLQFPSLNLAHSVACLAYEITRNAMQQKSISQPSAQLCSPSPIPSPLTTSKEEEAFLHRVIEVCERTSYPPGKQAQTYARKLRQLIRRSQPSPGDYGLILGLFRELDRLHNYIQKHIASKQ